MQLPCLSIHQPWVWAISVGLKRFENRSWIAAYRGPLLIHAAKPVAGKARAEREFETAKSYIEARLPAHRSHPHVPAFDELVRGGIVGAAKLVTVHAKWPSVDPWHNAGYYGYELADFVTLPFRARLGQQRFFHVELTADEAHLLKESGIL